MAHYIYRNISFTLTKILAVRAQGKHPGGEETYLNVARLHTNTISEYVLLLSSPTLMMLGFV